MARAESVRTLGASDSLSVTRLIALSIFHSEDSNNSIDGQLNSLGKRFALPIPVIVAAAALWLLYQEVAKHDWPEMEHSLGSTEIRGEYFCCDNPQWKCNQVRYVCGHHLSFVNQVVRRPSQSNDQPADHCCGN